ncbi:MAG TPA: DUF6165 family protein [Chitinispirillaceae bacterium]|nr:hypothetical protein [Fibrobacter sp.]HLV30900.1 DUF6165 family protein [Chitinispirillaceae bacterium]
MKIHISIGELVDKVTILTIKLRRITDKLKLKNIKNEYNELIIPMNIAGIQTSNRYFNKLLEINTQLWKIEDRIRLKESKQQFDDEFIQLARSIYFINDKRSEVKKEINLKYGSDIIEEKEYVNYKAE